MIVNQLCVKTMILIEIVPIFILMICNMVGIISSRGNFLSEKGLFSKVILFLYKSNTCTLFKN